VAKNKFYILSFGNVLISFKKKLPLNNKIDNKINNKID